jgi:hypothetical protein
VTASSRIFSGMNDATRFEFLLPAEQRGELDELAAATGLSVADLARLGIGWVIKRRDVLVNGREGERAAGA